MIAAILKLICRLIFRVNVSGIANLPQQGKLLVIANHESFLDGLLLGQEVQLSLQLGALGGGGLRLL